MSETRHPETWHLLFLRREKQAIAQEALGLGDVLPTLAHIHANIVGRFDFCFDEAFS
ncbi:hypothetical protein GXW74_19800 [Roseomonas eburnea]|uniref:Uncharacterized protein n=1 Tax=Neoroseomonas eburnea TaxID=1346889 RepID=A0A9X9XGB0_9PROT|nr:hypothetical protein [Neoroseomonas eburnea]MBR0682746.1 hypothetical protein [Neoroseomonas eburnea]